MKRIVTLMLAMALVAGFAVNASAADIKASGMFDFAFEWVDNTDFVGGEDDTNSEDDFVAKQRFRTQIDIVTDENLSGTVYFEIGDINWGATGGGQKGTDGINVETRRAYVDFVVPNTGLDLRVGLQGISTPGAAFHGPMVFDSDAAGVVAHYAFNDMVEMNAIWTRPYSTAGADTGANDFDELDIFGAVVGVHMDGVEFVPYALYASVGKDSTVPAGLVSGNGTVADNASAWWAGFASTVTVLDPVVVKADVLYGTVDAGDSDDQVDRAGWLVAAEVAYKMDMFTPALLAFYGTGDDDDATNGSERLPFVDDGFNPSSFAFGGNAYTTGDVISDPTGKMGVYVMLQDIKFVEDLTHQFRVGYMKGTNDKANAGATPVVSYFTEDDSAWEINFDHKYSIYENLSLTLELGYISVDFDDDNYTTNNLEEDAYKASFNLRYTF